MADSTNLETKYVTHLSALSFLDHLRTVTKSYFIKFIGTFGTSFLALWGIGEAFDFFGIEFTFYFPYLSIVLISVVISISFVVINYINTTPSGFETEKQKVKRIAHIKRPKWEFKLTKSLLKSHLTPIETELEEILDGQHFVSFKSAPTREIYSEWIQLRIDNLRRMVDVSTNLMVFRLSRTLRFNKGELASEKDILNCIYTIKKFYRKTYEFESELLEIKPPAGFEHLHNLHKNWSLVVRDSINQIHEFLDKVIETDFKKEKNVNIEFIITVKSPEKINDLIKEMERLGL